MVIQNQMVISYSLTLQKYHQVINSNHHLRKRYHQVRYHHLRSPSSPLPASTDRQGQPGNLITLAITILLTTLNPILGHNYK